ncbi:MAG: ferritin family protein [candidate division Zixibacteria bacterium]|nr:ferritin family protein [candidate division Zixibacteria bacterium]
MDVIKYAMQMELDGVKFYEQAARAAPDKLREIFEHLADEERRHFKFFYSLSEGQTDKARKNLISDSLGESKNIFVQMIEQNAQTEFSDEVREVWRQAREIEEKAVAMYTDEAEKENNVTRKDLLWKIAEEERRHIYLIENVLSFLIDPQGFAASQQYASFKSAEGH